MAEGTVIAPCVEVGTAGLPREPPPSDASPLETVYVQVMPVAESVHVSAHTAAAVANTKPNANAQILIPVAIFIVASFLPLF